MATNIFEDKFVGNVINNKIQFCYDANKVLSEYKLFGALLYAIVDFKKQQLIAYQGCKMIILQLFNFVIVEECYLRGFQMNNFQFRVIQDESNQSYFIIFVAYIKMDLRKFANSKVQFQLIKKYTPSNFQINKYCLAYDERAYVYIRYNSNGKLIRKLFCPYRGYKHLDSILVIPHRYINQEYCTEIVNSNSMKIITQLNAKSGQYVDSILVKGANKLIILNQINIMVYDADSYQLIEDIKIPNYGIPKQINYNSQTGIQIYYENYNIEFPKQQN